MKHGRTLQAFAQEIGRQKQAKRDFIAPSSKLSILTANDGKSVMRLGKTGKYAVSDLAHAQIASRLDIPIDYYRNMQKNLPSLLDTNVNAWLETDPPEACHLVRTLDGRIRAFLGNGYRSIDNADIAQEALQILRKTDCRIESCEITERHLYLKAVTPKIEAHLVGERVQAGVSISNSEVGCGSVCIEPILFVLSCTNGNTFNKLAVHRRHVGRRRHTDGDEIEALLSDETRATEDAAFFLRVRDLIRASLTQAGFTKIVKIAAASAERKFEAKRVDGIIEVIRKTQRLRVEEAQNVLGYLAKGGKFTQWGLSQAVTRAANDIRDYERATACERAGGEIITLGNSEWKRIVELSENPKKLREPVLDYEVFDEGAFADE